MIPVELQSCCHNTQHRLRRFNCDCDQDFSTQRDTLAAPFLSHCPPLLAWWLHTHLRPLVPFASGPRALIANCLCCQQKSINHNNSIKQHLLIIISLKPSLKTQDIAVNHSMQNLGTTASLTVWALAFTLTSNGSLSHSTQRLRCQVYLGPSKIDSGSVILKRHSHELPSIWHFIMPPAKDQRISGDP